MAEFWYRDTAWRKAVQLWYRDGGVWRGLKEAWYRDGGVWRKVFGAFQVATGNNVISDCTNPTAQVPTVRFFADGTVDARDGSGSFFAQTNWGASTTPAIGAAYFMRAAYSSGNSTGITNGASAATALSATITFSRTAATAGNFLSSILSYQIATDVGMTNVVGSGTITLLSDRT